MKKIILSAAVAFTVLTTTNVVAQQGFGTNTPDRSAAVDIVSSKRGLLIPRIDIPNLDEAAPVANPANALMVYNTGKTTAAGFYYWDASYNNGAGRWVRFVSSNSGSAVTVSAGNNVTVTSTTDGRDTDYKVSVTTGNGDGQVLVTKKDGDTYITEWVNPQEFINGSVEGVNGITTTIVNDKVQVGLGGALDQATTIDTDGEKGNTLAITGLEELVGKEATTGTKFNAAEHEIVVMGADGILKKVNAKALVEDAIDGGIDAKTLKGDGITVTAGSAVGTSLEVASALLKDVTLGIADGAVKNSKIDSGAVTADKMASKDTATGDNAEAGKVPVADGNGGVTYQTVSSAIGKELTTDGKIVIGANGESSLADAVLVDTFLSIKEGSITTVEIADGTISNVDLGSQVVSADKMTSNTTDNGKATPADKGQIPVADGNGGVTYQQVTGDLVNGKALTSGSISVFGGEKAVLDATRIDITGGTTTGEVLVTSDEALKDEDGNVVKDAAGNTIYVTKWVKPGDLGNTVTASNGLTKDANNNITLGGTIDTPTTLALDNTKGSLAITGLGTAAKDQTNKTVVVQADGKLATVDTAAGNVTINQGGDVNVTDNSVVNNYHPSMSEIVIEVTLGATDTNLSLPTVNGTEGQTISVKIVNLNDKHDGYLNIKSGNDVLAYGAMPHQGWIIKSNGTKWIVVGRN